MLENIMAFSIWVGDINIWKDLFAASVLLGELKPKGFTLLFDTSGIEDLKQIKLADIPYLSSHDDYVKNVTKHFGKSLDEISIYDALLASGLKIENIDQNLDEIAQKSAVHANMVEKIRQLRNEMNQNDGTVSVTVATIYSEIIRFILSSNPKYHNTLLMYYDMDLRVRISDWPAFEKALIQISQEETVPGFTAKHGIRFSCMGKQKTTNNSVFASFAKADTFASENSEYRLYSDMNCIMMLPDSCMAFNIVKKYLVKYDAISQFLGYDAESWQEINWIDMLSNNRKDCTVGLTIPQYKQLGLNIKITDQIIESASIQGITTDMVPILIPGVRGTICKYLGASNFIEYFRLANQELVSQLPVIHADHEADQLFMRNVLVDPITCGIQGYKAYVLWNRDPGKWNMDFFQQILQQIDTQLADGEEYPDYVRGVEKKATPSATLETTLVHNKTQLAL